jgi:GT2 family glycosyltransferase
MTASDSWPTISVVVPTRNRPQHALDCAKSILATAGFIELVIVDQSDNPQTREALATLRDERLRYVHSTLRGATNGRNVGIENSRGHVVAFTDDDCRVAADWISSIASIFRADPEIGIVCGRVTVPLEMQQQGFAAEFEPVVREWQNRFPAPGTDWGITANFAVRRAVFDQVGKFDPMLGPGAPLLCGEEPDILFRVLRAGLKVVNASEAQVEHLGIRAHGEETRALWDTYTAGTAAALFKHVRLGDLQGTTLYASWLAKSGMRVVKSVLTGTRPTGARSLKAFVTGSLSSWKFKIDREKRVYAKR